MRTALLAVTAAAAVVASALAEPSPTPLKSGIDLTALDRSVRPQDDLFRFANGGWIERTAIPEDRTSYGTLTELGDRAEANIRGIIEGLSDNRRITPQARQVTDLYASLMNAPRIESLGGSPISQELRRIDDIATTKALAAEAGRLSALGLGGPFGGEFAEDGSSPTVPAVRLAQGGTMLPSRTYYLSSDPQYVTVREQYLAYLTRIFELSGRTRPAADATSVEALEAALARAQRPATDPRAPLAESAAYSLGRLRSEFPGFDWNAWAKPQGIDHVDHVLVAQPTFFRTFAALVPSVPIETWKAWLAARYISATAPYLSRDFADARFDFFGRILSGQAEPRPRWKTGVLLVSQYLGDTVGCLYVQRYFPRSSRTRVEHLVGHLVDAYRSALSSATWLSNPARREGLRKLGALKADIGYPDAWRDYDDLLIRPNDLLGNITRAREFEGAYRYQRAARTTDTGEWMMSPQTVNAAYTPERNSIIFPAAILQSPLFQPEADDAANYGSIGAIIGHEVAHALDQRGRRYDAEGQVHDWWTSADAKNYAMRVTPVLAQLRAYVPLPGLRVNAATTATETLADLAGLAVACRAYEASLQGKPAPVIDGFTGMQRLFLAWAQTWRTKMRDEYLRQLVMTGSYAPPQYRVNGTVSNLAAFHDAFGVAPGDGLYRPPESRARVW